MSGQRQVHDQRCCLSGPSTQTPAPYCNTSCQKNQRDKNKEPYRPTMGSRGKEHTGGCSSITKESQKNEEWETQLQKNKVDRIKLKGKNVVALSFKNPFSKQIFLFLSFPDFLPLIFFFHGIIYFISSGHHYFCKHHWFF